MFIAGLTGGLASGKTTMARLFEECGAKIIDADLLAREVVQPRRTAWKDIVKTFGQTILTSHGTVDRATLATVVFRNPAKLTQLTNILYPRVAREQQKLTREISRKDPTSVVIYDAAMLIESGAYRRMNTVIVVKTDRATQVQRACARSGFSKAEAARRIRHQLRSRERLQYADYVLDGRLPLRKLRPIVQSLYDIFREQARTLRDYSRATCSSVPTRV